MSFGTIAPVGRAAAAAALLLLVSPLTARADGQPKCAKTPLILWGDGAHDDTKALNAWLNGDDAEWAQSGKPVGPDISDRVFLLSSAIYIQSGTGRTLERFRMVWPQRQETLSGGTIAAGTDPDKAPMVAGISKIGGDAGEGVPFDSPDAKNGKPETPTNCFVS